MTIEPVIDINMIRTTNPLHGVNVIINAVNHAIYKANCTGSTKILITDAQLNSALLKPMVAYNWMLGKFVDGIVGIDTTLGSALSKFRSGGYTITPAYFADEAYRREIPAPLAGSKEMFYPNICIAWH